MLTADFLPTPGADWLRRPLLAEAGVLPGIGSIGVRIDGVPAWRLSLCDLRERSPFSAIACVGETVFIGLGQSLYVAVPRAGTLARHVMDPYFGGLRRAGDLGADSGADDLFALSASRVHRFAAGGRLLWTSGEVGIDGVVVSAIGDGVLHGEGEWDPPGGWRAFALDTMTGRPCARPRTAVTVEP